MHIALKILKRCNKLPLIIGRINIMLYIASIIIFINIGFADIVYSQSQPIKFRHLTLDQGLSQSNVQCILIDSKGYMWFGTEDGLNKYDGYSFRIYRHDPADSLSISSNYISEIIEDSRGKLWISTLGGGLNLYDRERDGFIQYPIKLQATSSFNFMNIYTFMEDHAGNFWIGFDTDGLIFYDTKNDTCIQYLTGLEDNTHLSYDDIWTLYEDRQHNIWIGTLGGGLNRLERDTGIITWYIHDPDDPNSLSNNEVRCVHQDRKGRVWIGTNGGGLNLYDTEKDRFIHYMHDIRDPNSISDNRVFSLTEDSEGNLWVGTEEGGLNLFDVEKGMFNSYMHNSHNPNSLSHNSVEFLYSDTLGTVWIGTYNGGVNYFNLKGEKFRHYQQTLDEYGLSNSAILCFYEDRNGDFWIGTDGGGVNYFDRDKNRFTHFTHNPANSNSLSHNAVLSVYEDKRGNMWVGTYSGGLNLFDRSNKTFIHYQPNPNIPSSIIGDDIRVIFEDSYGKLWVGTFDGLNLFDRDRGTFFHYLHDTEDPNTISYNEVVTIYEDSQNQLWLGTYGGGLNLYDRENDRFHRFMNDADDDSSLSNNYVFSILEDSQNRLWIGTGAGLNLMNRKIKQFTHYRVKDGLPNDFIAGILEDDHGYLWLSTHKGLSKFDIQNRTFRNYDTGDGLQSNDFHYGTCWKSRSGELYFGGVNGFNVFYPNDVSDNPFIPPIVITDFKIANTPVPVGQMGSPLKKHISETREIVLSYKHSVFSFEFSALNYLLPQKNEYAFKMEGFEDDWNYVGTQRTATYTNLDPGEYTFKVIGSNNDLVWNDESTSIKITITPPFWQTWWFRLTAIVGILFFIYFLYLFRTLSIRDKNRQLESINKNLNLQIAQRKRAEEKIRASLSEKEVMLKEIHHRVKNNLQVISSLLFLQTRYLDDEHVKSMFKESRDRIRSMALVHEKLYQSENLTEVDFAEYIKSLSRSFYSAYHLDPGKIQLNINIEKVHLAIDKAIPFGLVVNELISNSLKHAFPSSLNNGGKIDVSFKISPDKNFCLSVIDNGVGMPEDMDIQKTESLGLKLVSILVEDQLDGKILLDRSNGTAFYIECPTSEKEFID